MFGAYAPAKEWRRLIATVDATSGVLATEGQRAMAHNR